MPENGDKFALLHRKIQFLKAELALALFTVGKVDVPKLKCLHFFSRC